jgi:hypothetical protein
MVGEEFSPRAAAAEDVLAACDVGLCRFGKPREVHCEWHALPVACVGGADRICRKEAQVLPQVDVAIVEVALGETDRDLVDGLVGARAVRRGKDRS